MYFRVLVCLLLLSSAICAQQAYPLENYKTLRARLLNRYLIPGDCHGCSLPASWYDSLNNQLVFEDETTRQLGWYIALLATEYHLLEQRGLPKEPALRELYFALGAINRLDRYAEYLQCSPVSGLSWDHANKQYMRESSCWNDTLKGNLNGYLIREDVPPGWHLQYEGDQPVRHGNGTGNWIVADQFSKHPHPASQDQLYHLLFGLAFVCKLIPDVVQYNGLFLRMEARNIVKRFMQIFDPDFQIKNPVSNSLLDSDVGGNGKVYSFFLAVAANHLVNGIEYPLSKSRQKENDQINPWFNATARNHKNLWSNFPGAMWSGVSLASLNQIMAIMLLSVSNALNGFPENSTLLLLNKTASFINPEYKIFQNAYSVLHDQRPDCGYRKAEMEAMLAAMDQTGPRRYTDPISCRVISNPVWNRDCIFVQPRIAPCNDRSFEGHFNGIDYLLFHNLYFMQYGMQKDSGDFSWADSTGLKLDILPAVSGNNLTLSYLAQNDERVSVILQDVSGRMIIKEENVLLKAGSGTYMLETGNQAQGIYLISILSSKFRKNKRVFLGQH